MKIIDENGIELKPGEVDLTLGRLVNDVEIVHHKAVEAVAKKSHFITIETYSNGSSEVDEIIDVAPVAAKPAWDETVPVQRYVRYTAEELAEQEKARREAQQRQEALDKLPETLDALKNENEMLKQCLLEMSETVYA